MGWTCGWDGREGKYNAGYALDYPDMPELSNMGMPELWKDLNVFLVRPQLEYDVQVWNPNLQRDTNKIERVLKESYKNPIQIC